jgi:hypothetical protein
MCEHLGLHAICGILIKAEIRGDAAPVAHRAPHDAEAAALGAGYVASSFAHRITAGHPSRLSVPPVQNSGDMAHLHPLRLSVTRQ